MTELIDLARDCARLWHRGQLYRGEPYADAHCAVVAQILTDAGCSEEQIAAGWLHDVVEDCGVKLERIADGFGETVAGYVWACTGEGICRAERNAAIASKIGARADFADVKVADRIANVIACCPGDRHSAKYLSERDDFERCVSRFARPELQHQLDRAYAPLELARHNTVGL